jgi:hypothetical protein
MLVGEWIFIGLALASIIGVSVSIRKDAEHKRQTEKNLTHEDE